MRARRTFISLISLIAWSVSAAAQQHPNVERGFQPEKVYQFGSMDNINVYNGNVTVQIPIGREYLGNGALKYQLILTYNSKAWDQQVWNYQNFNDCFSQNELPALNPGGICFHDYIKSVPSRRSNAGMGWLLSLGRLLDPQDPLLDPGQGESSGSFIYESPDGADHVFSQPDTQNPAVTYTRDGSYLRLMPQADGQYEVQFPDGMIHLFKPVPGSHSFQLEDIRDRFGNHLDIEYPTNGDWELTEKDSLGATIRRHYVRFVNTRSWVPSPENAPLNYDRVVSSVDVAAFGGTRAEYRFEYTTDEVTYGCFGDFRRTETPNPKVPRLRRVILPDTGAPKWEFDYGSPSCSALNKLVFPTNGRIQWTYKLYVMPTAGCRSPETPDGDPRESALSSVEGVETKSVFSGGNEQTVPDGMWKYDQVATLDSPTPCSTWDGATSYTRSLIKKKQSKVTIESPDGLKAEHYFSIWDDSAVAADGIYFDASEFGLPFTRAPGSGCAAAFTSSELCLSSREFDCRTGTCSLLRTNYVRYEGDFRTLTAFDYGYRREVARRTEFNDDVASPGPPAQYRFIDVVRSRYDGLGHYRKIVTSDSWSGLSREEITNFNPGKLDVAVDPATWLNSPPNNRPAPSDPKWLLNLFDATSTSENGVTLRSAYCFDAATGFLTQKRTLRGVTPQTDDLLTVFDQLSGNVTKERYFGGDVTPVPTSFANCASSNETAPYSLTHQYSFGTRSSTQYAGVPFKSLDLTIDANTGLPSSSADVSGLQSIYKFDALARLTEVKPPGEAWTKYTYGITSTPPSLTIRQWPNGAPETGSPLTDKRFYFDGLGRPTQTRALMPEVKYTVTRITYDKLGRQATVSTPEYRTIPDFEASFAPLHESTWAYDVFDRVSRLTLPDGKSTTTTYAGARSVARVSTVEIGSLSEANALTEETYDGSGRLIAVKDANGAETSYRYDPANRLAYVKSKGSEATQFRTFTYDNRGLLTSETHPENGTTRYSNYDARGHAGALFRNDAISAFDLQFSYDSAERLISVKGRTPSGGSSGDPDFRNPFRLLKTFEYGVDNLSGDRRLGKLLTATRYNYAPRPRTNTYKVSETYQYRGPAGEKSDRRTELFRRPTLLELNMNPALEWVVTRSIDQKVEYDQLGNVATVDYPQCFDCAIGPNGFEFRVKRAYDAGWLKSVSGTNSLNPPSQLYFVDPILRTASGMATTVLHANGIFDGYMEDNSGLARPRLITFHKYGKCTLPAVTGVAVTPSTEISSGQSVTLTVQIDPATASGTTYQWYAYPTSSTSPAAIAGATSTALTVTPTTSTFYYAVVRNACNAPTSSPTITITVQSQCVTPTVALGAEGVPTQGYISPNGANVTLVASAKGTAPLSYKWFRQEPGGDVEIGSGTSARFNVPGVVTRTTTFRVHVTNSCTGSADSTFIVQVALPPPGSLVATKNGTSVAVVWGASPNATNYILERRKAGSGWTEVQTLSSTTLSYTDTGCAGGETCAYRVRADVSLYSNVDVVTMMPFTPVAILDEISRVPFNELLTALNAMRAAAGWPAVTWQQILPASVQAPEFNVEIQAAHITSLRREMNNALQALGAFVPPFLDSDPYLQEIKAQHVTELQQRAQ